jgi:hypothetical protein
MSFWRKAAAAAAATLCAAVRLYGWGRVLRVAATKLGLDVFCVTKLNSTLQE